MKNYYLTGGRMTYAKNFDLVIQAFNKLKLPLKIYGNGILRKDLEKLAKDNIEFLGRVDDEELSNLYSNAKAFIVAQKDEDFGITPIEANFYGCPVIAYRGGGYLESVVENKSGLFFDQETPESLVQVVKRFEDLSMHRKMKFKPEDCINQAKIFSKERFKQEMLQFINARTSRS